MSGPRRARLLSPEAEACGGHVLTHAECADRAVAECGGLAAAIGWCRTWAHRPYFKAVLAELASRRPSVAASGGGTAP